MNWLKSEICHAHGYSSPVYTYIKGQSLEDVKYEIRNGSDGDRDGIREPRWTLLETLPPEVLAAKIKEAEGLIKSGHWWIAELTGVPHQGADALREALARLVTLEDERIRLQHLHAMGHGTDYDHYHKTLPIAWAAARAALAQHHAPQQGEQYE